MFNNKKTCGLHCHATRWRCSRTNVNVRNVGKGSPLCYAQFISSFISFYLVSSRQLKPVALTFFRGYNLKPWETTVGMMLAPKHDVLKPLEPILHFLHCISLLSSFKAQNISATWYYLSRNGSSSPRRKLVSRGSPSLLFRHGWRCFLPGASRSSSCLCLSFLCLLSAPTGSSWTPAALHVWPPTRGSSELMGDQIMTLILACEPEYGQNWNSSASACDANKRASTIW